MKVAVAYAFLYALSNFELDRCGTQSVPSEGKAIFDVGDAYAGLASGGDSVQATVGKPWLWHITRTVKLHSRLNAESSAKSKQPRTRNLEPMLNLSHVAFWNL